MRSTAQLRELTAIRQRTVMPPRAAMLRRAWRIAALAGAVAVSRPARAFTIQTFATEGCHERVTKGAWSQARQAVPDTAAALPSSGDDAALIADVPFDVPSSMRDIGGVTLLLGVRDSDVKQHGPNDLQEVSIEASDPKLQHEHCLRAPNQDEPNGSRQAVEACRAFIRDTLLSSLEGLDAESRPDPAARDRLRVSLAIRDEIEVSVPRFFLRAGRGLHAIQDSFTHTFRNPEDVGKIRTALNFVDFAEGTLDEAVDGPPHSIELDQCDDADELRKQRRLLAQEASGVALTALLDASLDAPAKALAVEAMLDRYVAFDETQNCSLENHWCDAPERAYGNPTLGCQFASRVPPGGTFMALAGFGVVTLLARRRRRPLPLLPAVGAFCLSLPARADEQGPIDSPLRALAGESDAATPGKKDNPGAFFARAAAGAAYDNTALSGGLGLHYQLAQKWMLGLDAEWNPYLAVSPSKFRSGSGNAYISLIRRYQLVHENVNIRSTASIGASMLLFDLVGADKYSIGPFFGVSFLGVEWKATRGCYLTVDPTYIAIPIPSIPGVPFMYTQYRFLVGVEVGG
jgi:hypothetical protein